MRLESFPSECSILINLYAGTEGGGIAKQHPGGRRYHEMDATAVVSLLGTLFNVWKALAGESESEEDSSDEIMQLVRRNEHAQSSLRINKYLFQPSLHLRSPLNPSIPLVE